MERIPDSMIIYQNGNSVKACEDYLYGFCHLFALCLREIFEERAEIKAIWQHLEEDMSDYGFLAHAYVVLDGIYWIDCRGFINNDIILDEYIINESTSYLLENSEEDILFHLKEKMFDDFEEKEKEQIMDFISDNIGFYCS